VFLNWFFAAVETAAYNDGVNDVALQEMENIPSTIYHGMCLITPSQTRSEIASDRATAQVSSESLRLELLFESDAELFCGVDCVVIR
jgi:hypothetical protein